jgi:RNA-binding motif protein, X-linked 2
MNVLTNIRSRQRQRQQEVINGVPDSASYHSEFRQSAYIFAGQLSFNLTEGDLLAVFSEYGEVVDVNLVRFDPELPHTRNLVEHKIREGSLSGIRRLLSPAVARAAAHRRSVRREKKTGKSRGFAFLAYEDQRSTDVAVDNLNGFVINGRTIAVDHVKDYKQLIENPEYQDTDVQVRWRCAAPVEQLDTTAGQVAFS